MLRTAVSLRQGRGTLCILVFLLLLAPAVGLPMHRTAGPAALRVDPTLFPHPAAPAPPAIPENLPAPGAGPEATPESDGATPVPVQDAAPADAPAAEQPTEMETAETPAADEAADASLRSALATALTGPLGEFRRRASLQGFYAERGDQPLWLDHGQPGESARALVAELLASEDEGLDPADYHAWVLQSLVTDEAPRAPEDQARTELLLTDAFLQLADNLASGRHPPQLTDPEWFIPAHQSNPVALLEQVAAGRPVASALASVRPTHPAYARLQKALGFYRALAATGGWPTLPPGDTLELDVRDPRVTILRQHLQLLGDAPADASADPELYDEALAAAVSHYQERHGLEGDGRVGRKTRAELNVSATERVEQIKLNLERWRWLPRNFGERFILVNVAGFDLELQEHDRVVQQMRVIIGQRFKRTPAFTERMTYLELNPYWNVPSKIAREELIPKLEAEPDYLDRQGIRILSDWSPNAQVIPSNELDWTPESGERFPYRLQQLPGPQNALGRIKFMFPNPFSIYLHDTPARNLFKRTVRTFSHGCIRVEKPMSLADWVLAGSRWDDTQIRQLIDTGEHKIIGLPKPIPVYVVYLTAWVDEDGQMEFRNDVYGRDRRMTETLASLPSRRVSD